MEKLGEASATSTVTSMAGSSSRARSAAEMPASLPPMTSRCMLASSLRRSPAVGAGQRGGRGLRSSAWWHGRIGLAATALHEEQYPHGGAEQPEGHDDVDGDQLQ